MATVTGVTNHWITAQEGFTTTLASTISSGATTVPLNSVSGYTNGDIVAFVIEPTDASKKQVFTGTIDTAGVQVTGVEWTEGTNQTHNAGVTVVDYWTATHQASLVKGLKVSHDQDGTLKSGAVDVTAVLADAIVTRPKLASTFATEVKQGWLTGDLPAVSTVTNNGNRSYDVTFASTVASLLSPGMRLQTTRTVTAPTQCTSLNGTTQYWSKTTPSGMTLTDDITVSAWVKLSSYQAGTIASRYTAAGGGWIFQVNASGQLYLQGLNGGAVNQRYLNTYQSLPLNKWVHVAASLDMSGFTTTTCKAMIDGVDVPVVLTSNGTNPTTFSTAGNLEVGSQNGGVTFFPGKIAQLAIFSGNASTITQATLRGYMSQGMSGSETGLISAYSFNNSTNDLNTTNANNLSAGAGSPTATNADSPFGQDGSGVTAGTTDYALVMKVSTTTATVQVPEGCTIPTSGNVASVAYSTTANPYGWVADKGRWEVGFTSKAQLNTGAVGANVVTNIGSTQFTLPVGSWGDFGFDFGGQVTHAGVGFLNMALALSTSSSTVSDYELMAVSPSVSASLTEIDSRFTRRKPLSVSSSTVYYLLSFSTNATTTQYINGNTAFGANKIFAIPVGI